MSASPDVRPMVYLLMERTSEPLDLDSRLLVGGGGGDAVKNSKGAFL